MAEEKKIVGFKLIKKGKKEGVLVNYTRRYVDATGGVVEVEAPGETHWVTPHADLTAGLLLLSPHYFNLIEAGKQLTGKQCIDPKTVAETAETYPVRNVIFEEGKNFTGVRLSGYKRLSTGMVCNMLSPRVKFNDPGEGYQLKDELQEEVETVRKEVLLLLGGKHAKPAQTSITDPAQHDEE
jgi:hypothetical protein